MGDFRRIFPLGNFFAVLVTVTLTGCPSTTPVDTSQRILVETGQALSHVDALNAGLAERQSDGAIERARGRAQAGECRDSEEIGDCYVRLVRDELEVYYRLTTALEAAHGTLRTWESANGGWRNTGEQPADWNQRICEPVREMVSTILDLLEQLDVEVPQAWRALIERTGDLCSLGVAVAGQLTGGE